MSADVTVNSLPVQARWRQNYHQKAWSQNKVKYLDDVEI